MRLVIAPKNPGAIYCGPGDAVLFVYTNSGYGAFVAKDGVSDSISISQDCNPHNALPVKLWRLLRATTVMHKPGVLKALGSTGLIHPVAVAALKGSLYMDEPNHPNAAARTLFSLLSSRSRA